MIAKAQTKADAAFSPSSTVIANLSYVAALFVASLMLHGCDDALDRQASFLFFLTTTTSTPGGVAVSNLSLPSYQLDLTSCDYTPAPIPGYSTTCGSRWRWLRSERGFTTAAAKCKVKIEEPAKCACLTCGQATTTTGRVVVYTKSTGACRGGTPWPITNLLWKCIGDKTNSDCASACNGDSSCRAYDWGLGSGTSPCCLYRHGNTGDGYPPRECWGKGGISTSVATTTTRKSTTATTRKSTTATTRKSTTGTTTGGGTTTNGARKRWSSTSSRTLICPAGETGDCMVPKGTELLVDANMDVGSLTIKGSVTWDIASDGLQLKAGFVAVEGTSGSFQLGTSQQPMLNRATIYLKNNGRLHPDNGKRFFGAIWRNDGGGGAGPSCRLHGRPLKHTWTLLVADVAKGARSLRVQHDLVNDDASLPGGGAWKVGDEIGVAPTGLPVTSRRDTHAGEKFRIVALHTESLPTGTITVIGLSAGLNEPKLGDVARRMQAEVVNLNRNVLITGDDFDSSDHGLHVRIANGLHAPPERGGIMQIQYARVEKCGQRGLKGMYCLHFHVMGDCGPNTNGGTEPRCLLRGNVVEDSQQRGIVVHGTHRSLVDQNVLWNVRGAGIYIEDGNEMANVISDNVNICPDSSFERQNCRAKNTDNTQADDIQQSGMWALSPSNDFLRNRMVNHYNAFFLQTSAFAHGKGFARGKVCTQHLPFGRFEGNVNHNSFRFGFYPDHNFPRRVKRTIASNGMVEDMHKCLDGNHDTWCSCDPFTPDGKDNGAPAVIADGLDWGNNFVGQYELGDVQYLRFHSVNNLHGMYWKRTKNFATLADIGAETWSAGTHEGPHGLGALPTSHLKGCRFEFFSDGLAAYGFPASGVALTLGPGGHGAFIVESTSYSGSAGVALASNQHCGVGPGTGSLCTPEFQLVSVSFSGLSSSTKWIRFGISDGDVRLPSYSSFDNSLDGYKGVAPAEQTHLLNTGFCRLAASVSADAAKRFDDGILCDKPLRRLQLWRGQQASAPKLSLTGVPGSEQDMFYVLPPRGGYEHRTKKGYGAVVIPGLSYTMSNLEALPGDISSGTTLEYSDDVYGNLFGKADVLSLALISRAGQQRLCHANSQHDRRFIAQSGPLRSGYGECLTGGTSAPPTTPLTPSPTPAPTPLCWTNLQGIAAEEGNTVGVGRPYSLSACQQACDADSQCLSFSACRDYGKCWLKDKRISGGETLQAPHGNCKTYYKGTCR